MPLLGRIGRILYPIKQKAPWSWSSIFLRLSKCAFIDSEFRLLAQRANTYTGLFILGFEMSIRGQHYSFLLTTVAANWTSQLWPRRNFGTGILTS